MFDKKCSGVPWLRGVGATSIAPIRYNFSPIFAHEMWLSGNIGMHNFTFQSLLFGAVCDVTMIYRFLFEYFQPAFNNRKNAHYWCFYDWASNNNNSNKNNNNNSYKSNVKSHFFSFCCLCQGQKNANFDPKTCEKQQKCQKRELKCTSTQMSKKMKYLSYFQQSYF